MMSRLGDDKIAASMRPWRDATEYEAAWLDPSESLTCFNEAVA